MRLRTLENPLLTGLLALLILGGCQGLNEEQSRRYESGLEAARSRRWTEAENAFDEVLGQKPRHAPGLLERGVTRFHLGKFDRAQEDLLTSLESGRLEPSQTRKGLFYLARARLEAAWSEPGAEVIGSEASQAATEALLELEHAAALEADYDVLAWKAFCHLSLRGYDAALTTLERCETLAPDRPEHRFFRALVQEALAGTDSVPGDALEIYRELVEEDSSREFTRLYQHLGARLDALPPQEVPVFLVALEEHLETGRVADGLRERVEIVRAELEEARRREQVQATLEEIDTLAGDLDFEEAHRQLEEALARWPGEPHLVNRQVNLVSSWIEQLEQEAAKALESERWEDLRPGLDALEKAFDLTSSSSHRARLQLKIDTLQTALVRFPRIQGFREVQALVLEGRLDEALEQVSGIAPGKMAPEFRPTYHFLRGWLHYQREQWSEALEQFRKIPPAATFLERAPMTGVCLWYAGQPEPALEILTGVPLETRTDEVKRILGHALLERGETEQALANLERLASPTRRDDEALARLLKERGTQLASGERWDEALEYWLQARRIVESRLFSTDAELYLQLARAYRALGEIAGATKVLGDLRTLEQEALKPELLREAHRLQAELHLEVGNTRLALAELRKLTEAGGEIPEEHRETYRRAVCLEQEYLPLASVDSWEYELLPGGERVRFEVVERPGENKARVRRTAGPEASMEVWERSEENWVRVRDRDLTILPVALTSVDAEFPVRDTWNGDELSRWEIVEIGETVELERGGLYTDCIRVRHTVKSPTPEGLYREEQVDHLFAPGIGEVLRETRTESGTTPLRQLVHFEPRQVESQPVGSRPATGGDPALPTPVLTPGGKTTAPREIEDSPTSAR